MVKKLEPHTQAIVEEYRRGDSFPILGRRYGVPGETIRRHLLFIGEPLRTQSEAIKARYGKRGDLESLAEDLGLTTAETRALLIKHGFLYDD